MRSSIRLWFALAAFLALAGAVLTVTAGSSARQGSVLLFTCAAAALYIGLAIRHSERRFARGQEPEEPEEPEVSGSIWPFVVSIAFVFVVIGAVGIRWVLVIGVIVLVVAGVGWFNDIQRQRLPHEHDGEPDAPAVDRLPE